MQNPKSKINEFLSIAVRAARSAGEVILNNLGTLSKDDIDLKQASDFVTKVDRESEETILRIIKERYPEHFFLAEETLKDHPTKQYRWIIDPLDGTTNYIHAFPVFAVSIALEFKGEILIGVVYDPLRGELFTAMKGKGAYLNGKRLRVSSSSMEESLLATGFPFRKKEFIELYLRLFRNLFNKVSDIRRAGSAAIDLAYVAAGRCDGFFELGLSPWDIAAGSLLIREAGGVVTDFGGTEDYLQTGNIVAASPILHGEILKEVKDVFEGIIDK
jgi:myo-inositol-1(or 4)-monophosphatase